MFQKAAIILSSMLFSASFSLADQARIELDLRDALARAPEANFQILLAQEGLNAQEQATRIARSALLPQVSLAASQTRNMSPNVGSFAATIPGVPERVFNDRFDALIRARLSLLDFGRWDDWNVSKLSLRATELQINNTIQDIFQRIAITYATHWRNLRRLDVIDARLERDELLLRIATDQEEAGVATALDVTRAEVSLAGNELARLQQETRVLESELQLKRALNLPLGAELVISRPLDNPDEATAIFSEPAFSRILSQRQDFQRLRTIVEREELALKASRRERLPSLDVSGQWGYASESWSDDMYEQWQVSLGVSMPIFEGFRLQAETLTARSDLRQRELELADLRLSIEADYRFVLQNLASALQRVRVAERTVALNEREFELARIRFEEGVADNSDVVSAQAALADAEDARVEAQFELLQSRINLARVEGDVRSILR